MQDAALDGVWKALADPIRRRMLDSLRAGPRTTGALCEGFSVSRFAVMKHLGVLERAGLVVVRRRGRERWNHLNVAPIERLYQRWVRPYEAVWAKQLLRLQEHVEVSEESMDMPGSASPDSPFGIAKIEIEVPIKAKRERVWQALTAETSQWWNKDFYTNSAARGFVIDARLGGHAYENWGDGAGQVWYTVIGLHEPDFLMMQGLLSSAYGGPAITILELRLQATSGKTVLQLTDTIFGNVSADKHAQTREGWQLLFDGGLRDYVERRAT